MLLKNQEELNSGYHTRRKLSKPLNSADYQDISKVVKDLILLILSCRNQNIDFKPPNFGVFRRLLLLEGFDPLLYYYTLHLHLLVPLRGTTGNPQAFLRGILDPYIRQPSETF